MNDTQDLTFLSVVDSLCLGCRTKTSVFTCFCGKDVCMGCALKHQQACQAAKELTMPQGSYRQIPDEQTRTRTKKRR